MKLTIKNISGALFWLFLFFSGYNAHSQVPFIQKVEPLNSHPNSRIVITGSGFGTNASQVVVWFGSVRGTITSISDFTIEAEVPPQATANNVEVINLSSRLSAKSSLKITNTFSGRDFSTGNFTSALRFGGPNEFFDLCKCDIDGDGKPDIVATKIDGVTDLVLLRNTSTIGNLSFTQLDRTSLPALDLGASSVNVVCNDLNGDGKPDLIISRGGATRNSVFVMPNTSTVGNISFGPLQTLFMDPGHIANRIRIQDMNGNGKPDLIVSNSFNNVVYLYENTSTGGVLAINPTPRKITITGATTTFGLSVQDLDGDRKPDIVVGQFQSGNLFVVKNNSTTAGFSFNAPQQITVPGALNTVIAGDVNGDGLLDLIVSSTFDNRLIILLNQSTASAISFRSPAFISAGNGPWGIDIGDIDGDGDIDIILATRNQAAVNIFLNNTVGNTVSFTRQDLSVTEPGRNIQVGDFDGDGKPDIAFTSFNSVSGAYNVEVIRNRNCYYPKLLNESSYAICSGQTVRLEAVTGLGVTYQWRRNGAVFQTGTNPVAVVNQAGNYTVTATSEGGACVENSTTVSITSAGGTAPEIVTAFNNGPICEGGTLRLSTGAIAGASYSWTGPLGFTSNQQNPQIANMTFDKAGDYKVVVQSGSCNPVEATTTVSVVALGNSFNITAAGSTSFCTGGNVALQVNSVSGYQYQWLRNGNIISGATNATYTANQAGDYTVRVVNPNIACEIITQPVTVSTVAPPVAAFDMKGTVCRGEQVQFTNNTTGASGAQLAYAWSFGDGANSTTKDPVHAYNTANTFTVTLQASYVGVSGCTNSANKPITVTSAVVPVITASAASSCEGDEVTLSISGTFSTINWSTGQSGPSIVVTSPKAYSATTTDTNGCTLVAERTIDAKPSPTLVVEADKNSISSGEEVQLSARGADTYQWSDGKPEEQSTFVTASNIANPIVKPITTTEYLVTGLLLGGCSASEVIKIIVSSSLNIRPRKVYSPNSSFEPTWIIENTENYPDCTLSIFDGRGMRIFEQKGYNNEWNGTFNGKALPAGSYFFVFGSEETGVVKGSVLLVR